MTTDERVAEAERRIAEALAAATRLDLSGLGLSRRCPRPGDGVLLVGGTLRLLRA